MQESEALFNRLKDLETKRKNREIGPGEFYVGLLNLLADLKDVLINENISDQQVKRQIPLLLAFIKSQIKELELRGN